MIEYVLGNYFVKKGLLTEKQLKNILDRQSSVKVRLGTIAVSEGLMTQAQADTVNMLQQSVDMHFGDIAVEKGYLTQAQVKALLSEQGKAYIIFMQTIQDEDLMSVAEFERAVRRFQLDCGITTARLEAMKSDDITAIVTTSLENFSTDFEQHAAIGIRLMTRLVDKDVYIGAAYLADNTEDSHPGVYQKLTGERIYNTGLISGIEGLRMIAKGFAREQYEEDELFIYDAAGEFLNCINGLFITTASREGTLYEAEPQHFISEADQAVSLGSRALHIPIFGKDGSAEFIFVE